MPRPGPCASEGIALGRQFGDRLSIAWHLGVLAGADAAEGRAARAARLRGAMEGLLESIGSELQPTYHTWIGDPLFGAVQQELGTDAYEQALAAGRAMSLSQAIEYAMEGQGVECRSFFRTLSERGQDIGSAGAYGRGHDEPALPRRKDRHSGGDVFWRCFGNGEGIPLLMIHGGPGLTSSYLDNFTALCETRPVFTWDQLDCGQSDRPDDPVLWTLDRFVEELELVRAALTPGPVHVLGHSWGATLAMEWLTTRQPAEIASVIFASPCLSSPRSIEDTRALVAQLSPEAQAAIAEAERTGEFRTPGYQAAAWGEWIHAHIVRQLPLEAIGSLLGSLAEVNANLELLEHMWGPSDFTVTGSLRNYDRTAELGNLSMPVLFHCGAALRPPPQPKHLVSPHRPRQCRIH